MPTRINTGIRVQATSIRVLWVVLEATGLALALNFTTIDDQQPQHDSVMTAMMHEQEVMERDDGVHDRRRVFLQLVFPRGRLSLFGDAAPLAISAKPATANPSNRRPIWPFDIFMPLALP